MHLDGRPNRGRNPLRVLLPLLVATACLALGPAHAKSSKDALKIGIITVNYSSPVLHIMGEAALKNCKERGWTCELLDGKTDPVATSNGGLKFINRGFDAILNIVSDNNQLGTVIKAANKAGIPYISIGGGSVPGITTDIGVSGVLQGALLGDEVRSAIGLSGKILMINWNVLPVLRERERGFRATMADDKNIEIIERDLQVQGYLDDAYKKLLAGLRSTKDVRAVVMGWMELVPGAMRAIDEAGLKGKVGIYSYDATEEGLELLRKKDSSLVMTVGNGTGELVLIAMQALAETIDGNPPKYRSLMTRSCVFTKQNVPPAGTAPDYRTCTPFIAELNGSK
jgi:ribose transport system substrate-binding protein